MSRVNHVGDLIVFFTLALLSVTGAQTSQSPSASDLPTPPPFKFTASVGLVAALIIIAVLLLAAYSLFTVHVSRTAESNRGAGVRRTAATGRGLDPEVVGTFPTLVYADVKGLRLGKGALECVVCLTEFEDDEVLRLIPKCDHVFHPECIDEWLGFHTTCPVCRADLVPRPGESIVPTAVVVDVDPPTAMTVQDEDEDRTIDREQGREPRVTFEDDKAPVRNPSSRRSGSTRPRKFSRSHSTGHSLVQPGENTERFTLRLPIDVRKQVMSRAVSMAAGAGSSRRGYRGEGSSRGKSIRRPQLLDRPFRSERWAFTRMPSFLTRPSPNPSPRVIPSVDGEGSCIGRLPSFLTRTSPILPNTEGGSTGRSNRLGEGPGEPSQLPV